MIENEQNQTSSPSHALKIRVPTREDLGWLLLGGGVVGVAINLLSRRNRAADWLVPVGLVGVGTGVLLRTRRTHMDAAEERIQTELEALDPVARAQVLKAVARDQIGRLPGVGSPD